MPAERRCGGGRGAEPRVCVCAAGGGTGRLEAPMEDTSFIRPPEPFRFEDSASVVGVMEQHREDEQSLHLSLVRREG